MVVSSRNEGFNCFRVVSIL